MVDKVFHDVYQALIGQQISRSTPTAPQDARAALHALTATPQQTNDTDQLANTLPTVQVCCSAALSVEPAPTVPKMPLDSRGSRRSSLPLAVHPVATTRRGAWSPPRRSCDGGIAVPACPVAHPAPPAAHRPCRRPNETTCRPCAGGCSSRIGSSWLRSYDESVQPALAEACTGSVPTTMQRERPQGCPSQRQPAHPSPKYSATRDACKTTHAGPPCGGVTA